MEPDAPDVKMAASAKGAGTHHKTRAAHGRRLRQGVEEGDPPGCLATKERTSWNITVIPASRGLRQACCWELEAGL